MMGFFGFIGRVLGITLCLGLAVAFVVGLIIGGARLNLWLMPWYIQQQTAVVHNSNGYVQSQAEGISDLYFNYNQATTSGQKLNIAKQICAMYQDMSANGNQTAYTYLTPSIQSFVSTNCQ